MIQPEKVTKFYGEGLIFSDVTFKIVDGEKNRYRREKRRGR